MQAASEHFVTARDGLRLFARERVRADARANLAFIHGFAEHSGRYGHTFEHFLDKGFSCFGIDVRGHGKSDGRRGHVERFEHYFLDVDALLARVKATAPQLPTVIVGHSHGGLISLLYALREKPGVVAYVLSAPFLKLKLQVPAWKTGMAGLLSHVWPALPMGNELDPADLMRDPEMIAAHRADPLVLHVATPRWFTEATNAQRSVFSAASQLRQPLLLLQGSADRAVDAEATRHLFQLAGSKDKTLKWYPGLFHELFNEPERASVFADMESWLEPRI